MRSARLADPGSKGWRVAWKTSFGLRPARQRPNGLPHEVVAYCVDARLRAWTERRDSAGRRSPTDGGHPATGAHRSGIVQRAGRHALNVETEVRFLVPESVGRIAESSAKQPRRSGSCGKLRRWFEGSTPSRSTRASSSTAESACLTNKRLLVRVQPRPLHRRRIAQWRAAL